MTGRTTLVTTFILVLITTLVQTGPVQVCKHVETCEECADSFIRVFGFQEPCKWCVETQQCGGPISCPLGKPLVQREAFRCPQKAQTIKGKRYTDRLGRSLYAMALAAKDGNVTECLANSRPDVRLIDHYQVDCDGAKNQCSGYLAVSEEAKALYVVYRGSTFDRQLFAEFIHGLAAQLGAWEKFDGGGGVITYFHGAFQKLFIEGGMHDALLEMKKKYPGYRVWVTGHSLGGSLASMTALWIVAKEVFPERLVRLVTFGEPRTGNVAFAKSVESLLSFRYRVVKKNDFVTNIPSSLDPNGIMVTPAMWERQPLFYRHLVHYDNEMHRQDGFKICELSDDHACRNIAAAIDAGDHLSYFAVNSDEYLRQRCKRSLLQ